MWKKEEKSTQNNRIYFDMTLSDSSQYQSETPDRRVEKGNDLTEFCHNLPVTYSVNCELQDGKRYSKDEFRGLFVQLRDKRVPITLYLGDEHFNQLILQEFSPNGQGSQKTGYEYTLNFKQITYGSIEEVVLQSFATAPSSAIGGSGSGSGSSGVKNTSNAKQAGQKQTIPKNKTPKKSSLYQNVQEQYDKANNYMSPYKG